MKFSLNLAQSHSNVELKAIPHDQILIGMGSQLGSIEATEEWVEKYHGVVVAKVVNCIKHPNADKLSLCLIDDGGVVENIDRDENGLVQVVCGAKNVREGILVAWIPPGASVPNTTFKEPFVLESRELRGEISNGMLASPKELDISDDHEGILEIDAQELGRELILGEPICDLFGLDDFIIDCENKMFTHRPDCFGNLGIARELAGIFGLKFDSPEWYKSDDANRPSSEICSVKLQIENNVPNLSSRFTAVIMSNVEVGSSPVWLQSQLKRVGIKSINNVVDVTNYVMHLTGQPLHAFDLDKLRMDEQSLQFGPRTATAGEKLKLLGDKNIELSADDIVISSNGKAVALAGIMGGAETEVDENTKSILIECANFDMYAIRRTSMRHGLFTDAVTRFNKGQSPLQNVKVLNYAIKLMSEMTGSLQTSEIYDQANFDTQADNLSRVSVSADFINSRLGSSLEIDQMKTMLENVEFTVSVDGSVLNITVPFWRMDISIEEDIVEEIGRLYGYNKLTPQLPVRTSNPTPQNKLRVFKKHLRLRLSQAGANEVLTYSFVHGKLLESTGVDSDTWAYHLRNAISPDLQYYRTSLMPSLISKLRPNLKAQAGQLNNEFALFEIGKAHLKGHNDETETELPKELQRLGLVFVADDKAAEKYNGSAYYQVRKYIDMLSYGQASFAPLDTNEYPLTSPFQLGRSAVIMLGDSAQPIGVIGEFKQSVKSAHKLPEFCAGFEIDVELLEQLVRKPAYEAISKHPSSQQDITFEVDEDLAWGELNEFLGAELKVAKAELGYIFKLSPLDIFQAEGSDKKRLSFRIDISHSDKTLIAAEINDLLDKISKAANEKFEAIRI